MNDISALLEAARTRPLAPGEARLLFELPENRLEALLETAACVRRRHFGDTAHLCSILNARSGRCTEDCVFCAQSARHGAAVASYPLLADAQILEAYEAAAALPIERFGIVTSGRAPAAADLDRLCAFVRAHPAGPAAWCASLGTLDEAQFRRLKDAGISRVHHNLETARSFFPSVCTTHTYDARVATVEAAMRAGLEVCSGGIFGLGESPAQRVELAAELRRLGVRSIPLNFLVPIAGTPAAARAAPLSPREILLTIAMFRLVCPEAEIKVCAGREQHLGAAEARIFDAGATGMMIGGYLTVRGRPVSEDLALLRAAGMTPSRGACLPTRGASSPAAQHGGTPP